MSRFTAKELAAHVDGRVEGDSAAMVTRVAPVDRAGPGDLTFVADRRHRGALASRRPTAVLVPEEMVVDVGCAAALIRVRDPHIALARLLPLFFPERSVASVEPGVHPSAVLGYGVRLGPEVSIGPYAILDAGCSLGRGTIVEAHVHVGAGAVIGEACHLGQGSSVLGAARLGDRVRVHPGARLGTEGYGFGADGGRPVKIPQVGLCRIGDDVEVGANTTIDRGALGDTVVGAGTKIDNLVHIGHNVRIGENCMIVAQVGVAGSVEIGSGVQLAGQAGIAGHLKIGDGARIAAQAGVIGDVPAGATYSGYPARPHREAMRASAALFRLPDLLRRLGGAGEDEDGGGEAGRA